MHAGEGGGAGGGGILTEAATKEANTECVRASHWLQRWHLDVTRQRCWHRWIEVPRSGYAVRRRDRLFDRQQWVPLANGRASGAGGGGLAGGDSTGGPSVYDVKPAHCRSRCGTHRLHVTHRLTEGDWLKCVQPGVLSQVCAQSCKSPSLTSSRSEERGMQQWVALANTKMERADHGGAGGGTVSRICSKRGRELDCMAGLSLG
eukprot:5296365-Prymnesium_polylepis.3